MLKWPADPAYSVKLVEVGHEVFPGQPSEARSYVPCGRTETSFRIKLYASPDKDPKFVDDSGCRKLGEVSVDCRDRYGNVGTASVALIFGGTELEVLATHNVTGEQTKCSFDFLE